MKKGFAGIFEIDSVVKILALCLLTIGSYLIYKLYCFSKQINLNTDLKIPNLFMGIDIVLFALSLGRLFYGLANFHDTTILTSSVGIHVVSSAFDITWIIMVRNLINIIAGSTKKDKLWLNSFITSIFHVIYMQHKINQGLSRNTIQDN
jgi:hypothetical protein